MKRWQVVLPIADWAGIDWDDRMKMLRLDDVDMQPHSDDMTVILSGDGFMPWFIKAAL